MKDSAYFVRSWSIQVFFVCLVLATTTAVSKRLWDILGVDGITALEATFFVLFTILVAWNSVAFWTTCLGAYAVLGGAPMDSLKRPPVRDALPRETASRTAILMPVFNEDPLHIAASMAAIHDSLREAGAIDRFDLFVLSDTTKPEIRASEETICAELRETRPNIYYRHRPHNIERKSGNIADFCRNWGAGYAYMIVLDADSMMSGKTMVDLVQLMDHNHRAAVIQVPPLLVGLDSLFARLQQFAASVYGPLQAAGFAALYCASSNYWGHNAIVRVRPFMEYCGLPKLRGRPPFGGEILSHDFVEAALLRKAGWDLHLAPDLGGSYERSPPTIMDYLKRDRRWCQGNLQHLPLIFAQGFRMASRLHLLSGVMSYLSSPLWLLMLIISVAVVHEQPAVAPVSYIGRYPILAWPISHDVEIMMLIAAMLVLLFGPKLLSLLVLLRNREARLAHGGARKVLLSVFLECIFAALFAPITMLSHTLFVVGIISGRSVDWRGQRRDAYRPSFAGTAGAFLLHTAIGVGAIVLLRLVAPDSCWWLAPLSASAALSILLAGLTSSGKAD